MLQTPTKPHVFCVIIWRVIVLCLCLYRYGCFVIFLYLLLCAVHVRGIRRRRAGVCDVTCASLVCMCVSAASLSKVSCELSCLCEYELLVCLVFLVHLLMEIFLT